MTTRERVILLTITGVIAIAATNGCAFAAGQRAPRPFCAEIGERLVLPGQLLDTASVWDHAGHLLVRLPVFTHDSTCVRHTARDPQPPQHLPDVQPPALMQPGAMPTGRGSVRT